MSFPKVPRDRKSTQDTPGEHVFWSVAAAYGQGPVGQQFQGDLTQFGFQQLDRDGDLTLLRKGIAATLDVLPNMNMQLSSGSVNVESPPEQKFNLWHRLSRCCFWRHPNEKTYAITVPYDFAHPYGDASIALLNFSPCTDPTHQSARNARFGDLPAANQSTTKIGGLYLKDWYISQVGHGGRTFSFAKQRTWGGRDQETQTACGYALFGSDAVMKFNAPDAPSLYLEMGYEDVAV